MLLTLARSVQIWDALSMDFGPGCWTATQLTQPVIMQIPGAPSGQLDNYQDQPI